MTTLNLNKDILFLIFEELQDDSKSLFSCLMVNRLWCKIVVPILWRNPWSYNGINYSNKSYLFTILACYLLDYIKEFITDQRIQIPLVIHQPFLFDYLSFCRSINVITIKNIISIGSSLAYNRFFMQQEFYFHFMRKRLELRYLDMRAINHQIFSFPEAKICIESLYELICDTSINYSYFYGLSRFCQHIQRIVIFNTDPRSNNGIVKLVEVQKNLKYFEWSDDFEEDYLTKDPHEEILLALEKKADNLNHLKMSFQYAGFEHTLLQRILPKFQKLKTLIIDDCFVFAEELMNYSVYNDLEVLNIDYITLKAISSIIVNSRGRRLKKIIFKPYDTIDYDDSFYENSLDFIRKIYENCPLIEYLSIAFSSSKEHFDEFEKLLKLCQNLKSLLVVILNNRDDEPYGEKLLKILTRSAPINLREIRFFDDFQFSLEILEEFFEKWKGRPALSMLTSDPIFEDEDYRNLINEYKKNGVIKDFTYEIYSYRVNYQF